MQNLVTPGASRNSLHHRSQSPVLVAVVVNLCLCAQGVRADLVLDFTGGSANTFGGSATVGWEFQLTAPVLVTGMGYWDRGADGLVNAHTVGLWNLSNPSLVLASTVVTTASSTPVASTSVSGNWRFNSISPLTLLPGSYVVGATILSGDVDLQQFNSVATMFPAATFIQARNVGGSSLTFPNPSSVHNDGVFGPNLQVTGVPESSAGLAAIAGALTLFQGLKWAFKRSGNPRCDAAH